MTDILYEPKGRALEFAGRACNPYVGCSHGCVYCYVPTLPFWIRTRAEFHSDVRPAHHDLVRRLSKQASRLGAEHDQLSMFAQQDPAPRVFLSFTTDPYQAAEQEHFITKQILGILRHYGINVDILTKNPFAVLRDIDLLTPDDTVGTTVTFPSGDGREAVWEPGAPTSKQRLDGLQELHRRGIPVWIALEPVIDAQASLAIIAEAVSFAQHFKIGALNHQMWIPRDLWRTIPKFNPRAFLQELHARFRVFRFRQIQEPGVTEPKTYYVKRSLSYG